ncbi:Bgt-60031 [Blumeria graminis f. sp. tritici]|uniref:Bgt-60031 n=1 Tax=Blumeria graminis f. sp. tritici TaxID=62690 RepID=A0A9X9MLT1_BLUGR|nr:Bgt-60031 [Blumeria graminis f. sp. tritici]
MRKVMMETGRVQRRKKGKDTPRGLHKSPMTTTTRRYDVKVQG